MHRASIFLGLTALLLALSLLSLGMGAVSISPSDTLAALSGNPVKQSHASILWDFRLARVLLVILCGSALASAGAAFQGLFRNPLADPYIVGASGGAALGATLAVVFDRTVPIGIAGFLGALAAVMVVYAIAEASHFGSVVSLLLAGAAMSTMLSAIVSLLLILSDEVLHEIFAWLMGGFSGRSWSHLTQAAVPALLGLAITLPMSRALDALSAGESSAEALGLDLRRARLLIVVGASLSTAAAVSASGIIGFIGLIAPHLARRLVGASHAVVLPASMLLGSILLLVADDLARTIAAPLEMPVGIFTALLGGPFFLFLLRRGQKEL
ncbi:MAG: iron ABC transporter permease [Anaerolineales bacterium]